MKKAYEVGDVFRNKLTNDKVIIVGIAPVAVKLEDESPMLHPDDPINVLEDKWEFVENRLDNLNA